MITLTPQLTPKQIFKSVYGIARSQIFCHTLYPSIFTTEWTQNIMSDTINTFIKAECQMYPTFAKQLRRYMLAYRHSKLGAVTPN